jgi:hypothetical protein
VPAVEETVSVFDLEGILDEPLHPLDVIVLPLEFELVANEKTQFLVSFVTEFL